MESWLQSWRPLPMRFAIFPLHLSKVLRLPRKSDAKSYEMLHPSPKIIFANLTIWWSKMQPFSGNQRPDLLTSLMNMSLVLRLPREMHVCRSSSNVPRLPRLLKLLQNPHILLFAAQRRALFEHVIFQQCSDVGVFCALLLANVLRATTTCNFSSLISHHLPKWLRTRRSSEPTFQPSGAPKHWKKHSVSRFFYLFAHLHLLASHPFSSLIFPLLLFSSLTLPTSGFSICPYCQKFDF